MFQVISGRGEKQNSLIQNNLPATIGNTAVVTEMGVEIRSPNTSPKYNLPWNSHQDTSPWQSNNNRNSEPARVPPAVHKFPTLATSSRIGSRTSETSPKVLHRSSKEFLDARILPTCTTGLSGTGCPLKKCTVNLQVSSAHAVMEHEDSLPNPLKFIDRNLSWAAWIETCKTFQLRPIWIVSLTPTTEPTDWVPPPRFSTALYIPLVFISFRPVHRFLILQWHCRRISPNCENRLRLSSCQSVRPHSTTRLSLDGFSWNFIQDDFTKIWPQNSIFINLLTPNVNYSGRTAPLTFKVAFYTFIQQI